MSTNVISEDYSASKLKQLAAELMGAIDKLQTERDQLLQRVAQLEAVCKQLSKDRSELLHTWADTWELSEEELDRRAKEPGGRSLAEIIARLEKL